MASTSAEMEQLTSGASNRIIFILRTFRKCLVFALSLVLSLLLLLRLRPRRRVSPLSSPEEEEADPAPSRRWRRKMAWKLEEEDTARRRLLAEGVDMDGDGEIPCRWSSSLFYGPRGNALFSRSWLPLSGELRGILIIIHGLNEHSGRYSQFAKQLNSSNLGVYAMDWIVIRLHCKEELRFEKQIHQSKRHFMALNPQLLPNGMPIPFVNEMFVLVRDGVEFEVDKIPGGHGGHVKAKGVIYLSNIRMVFVASKPVENFVAFDMPLLYIHAKKFNQPIFHCNNISGQVEPVVPENEHRALYSTHTFKILFKEGGCGTFVPLFLNLISSVRQYNRQMQQAAEAAAAAPRVDPLQAAQTPVDEMMRHAYVDPNDPTRIYLQQPSGESQLRRRAYHPSAA